MSYREVMLRHRPPPRSPWGACALATAALLAALLLVPQGWWQTLWRSTRPAPHEALESPPAPAFDLLEIAAPPEVEVVATTSETRRDVRREVPDAQWWDRAWEVRVHADVLRELSAAGNDSASWTALGALDLPTLLSAALSLPDSVLAARIWELAWEDKVDLTALADYFRAIGRSRVYADLKSREAAMFGEFMFETVPVTETGDD